MLYVFLSCAKDKLIKDKNRGITPLYELSINSKLKNGRKKIEFYSIKLADSSNYILDKLSWENEKSVNNIPENIYYINPTTGDVHLVFNNVFIRKRISEYDYIKIKKAFDLFNSWGIDHFEIDAKYNLTISGDFSINESYTWSSNYKCSKQLNRVVNTFIEIISK